MNHEIQVALDGFDRFGGTMMEGLARQTKTALQAIVASLEPAADVAVEEAAVPTAAEPVTASAPAADPVIPPTQPEPAP